MAWWTEPGLLAVVTLVGLLVIARLARRR